MGSNLDKQLLGPEVTIQKDREACEKGNSFLGSRSKTMSCASAITSSAGVRVPTRTPNETELAALVVDHCAKQQSSCGGLYTVLRLGGIAILRVACENARQSEDVARYAHVASHS